MSRWDYDTVFYRVFCITLLAIAFTFTLILTNVFVDIDGLLSRKDKAKPPPPVQTENEISEVMKANIMLPDDRTDSRQSEDVYDDKDYQDSTDLYRSKRSLAPPDLLFNIKDREVKKILTNRLSSLLDELDVDDYNINSRNDNQESINESKDTNKQNAKTTLTIKDENDKTSKLHLYVLKNEENIAKEKTKIETNTKRNKESKEDINNDNNETKMPLNKKDDSLLHLAMHNIVLQGIIGRTNLDIVYKKLADLVKSFDVNHPMVKRRKEEFSEANLSKETDPLEKSKNQMEDEKIFDELMKFSDSKKQIEIKEDTRRNMIVKTNSSVNNDKQKPKSVNPTGPNVMIKTIIDITALTNDKTNKAGDMNSNDRVNGVVQLIYNGKSIKLNNTNNTNVKATESLDMKRIEKEKQADIKEPNSYYRQMINNYLKRYSKTSDSSEHDKFYSRKRLKRHIKIRYEKTHEKTTQKPKPKTKSKTDDDELFVEIETHFDSKGTKGEKKKKMIRDLIQKIQNAIHSNIEVKKKKRTHWHVKKRTQSPLDRKTATAFINKLMLPLETLAHRHLDPISKAVPAHETMPLVSDGFGHNHWHQRLHGPRFLEKHINSAEMNTGYSDYSKTMSHNGIPQRLQKPINTDISDEVLLHDSRIIDLGNVKFLMKDIDGSGFSIGFNQYTDEAPDGETMKLFAGLENVIQTYHQKYDQEGATSNQQQSPDGDNQNDYPDDVNENLNLEPMDKPAEHMIERRSVEQSKKLDHHTNTYKTNYDNNPLPLRTPQKKSRRRQKYHEIYKSEKGHVSNTKKMKTYRTKQTKTLFLDENVFDKKLKPAEILSIADMFERKKRSFNVKKISNVKMKNKISRYLNTKTMASKSIFMNKKRSKREVDKIRIVARDVPASHELPNEHRHSGEDIFVVSDEKIYADRAVVREVEVPEIEPGNQMHFDMMSPEKDHIEVISPEKEQYEVIVPENEHYDVITPQKQEEPYNAIPSHEKVNEDHFDIGNYMNDAPTFDTDTNEFTKHARHNSLMSRYPHIIMEEISRSKEEIFPDNQYTGSYIKYSPYQEHSRLYKDDTETDAAAPTGEGEPIPNGQVITDLIQAPKENNNYKVTVKIRPKNTTGTGFKEVHTSINKSYNKNGLLFTSLVNVSQLSKVEKINRSISRREASDHAAIATLKQQQDVIKTLIKQHKHRIDEQLKQLKKEREKLDTMNIDHVDMLPQNLVNVAILNNPKARYATKNEINKLLTEETINTKNCPPVTEAILPEPTTVTTTTTTEYVQPTTEEDKNKISEKFERNENITNEILKKLDQNTDVLKMFLGKLISKIDAPTRKSNTEKIPVQNNIESNIRNEDKPEKTNESYLRNDIPQPKIGNNLPYNNFEEYHQNLPNMFFRKYNTPVQTNHSLGIPFVYAYQHPYSVVPNKEPNMASIVYHGHIHTNTVDNKNPYYNAEVKPYYNPDAKKDLKVNNDLMKVNKKEVKADIEKEFWKPKHGEKVINDFVRKNSSRFFLDELDDFKVLSLTEKQVFSSQGRPINGTTV